MYGGAKLTLVAMTPVVIFYAIAFTRIWPFMTHGISALTGFMKNAGVAGVFVYGFFEKFLIPTGLHHFVWSPSSSPRLAAPCTWTVRWSPGPGPFSSPICATPT